jgi:serine/threonine-protein kinase
MSPEQASGYVVDGRTDLFSLGAVLYELLSGRRAFEGHGVAEVVYQVVNEEPPPLSLVRPGLPRALDAVLARVLAKDPVERYPDGRAFADALQAIVREEELITTSRSAVATQTFRLPTPTTLLGRSPGRRLLQAAGAVVVVGLAALTLSSGSSRGTTPALASDTGSAAAPSAVSVVPAAAIAPLETPALLALSIEHSQKQGRLKFWIDEKIALDRPLVSTQTKKLLFLKRNSGRVATVMSVPPGQRSLRIEIRGDAGTRTRNLRADFKTGEARTLQVKVGNAIETAWVQ